MIGIEGQYLLKLKIQDNENFIEEPQLISFKIIEEAGNILPIFELLFITNDEDIIPLLNEGNTLEVSLGRTRDDLVDMELYISTTEDFKNNNDDVVYKISGFLNKLGYINNPTTRTITQKSGIAALKEVVSDNFKPDFNVSISNDKQNWIQPYTTDKKFANELWLHSWNPNSFYATSITIENEFRLRDIKKSISSGFLNTYAYKFTMIPEKDNDILIIGSPIKTVRSGFLNMWVGYGREKHLLNLETGLDSFISEEVSPILSNTNSLIRNSNLNSKRSEIGYTNENVHENYWNAYIKNLQHLAIFNTVEYRIDFEDLYIPIKTLDIIMLKDIKIGEVSFASEYNTGLYIVNKVTREISGKKLKTVVRVSREALNDVEGDLK